MTGGMFALISQTNIRDQSAALAEAVAPADWVRGNADATLTLVEYSDFECPACAAHEPNVQNLLAASDDRLALVYRHFPLPQHKHARSAAAAAEAAGKQGKFWEMHDMIFDGQRDWTPLSEEDGTKIFDSYASTLGLDVSQYEKDFSSDEVTEKIERDRMSGVRSRVDATPTFFLNGKKVKDPYAAVKDALAQ